MVIDRDRLVAARALRLLERGEERIPVAAESHRAAALHHAVHQQGYHQVYLQLAARVEDPVGDRIASLDAAVGRVHGNVEIVERHVPPHAPGSREGAPQRVGAGERLRILRAR
jgi:hypothetical protein